MSEQSKIQWCDSTVNFWEGCTKVSPGCLNCYAEARDKRHMIEDVDHWGKGVLRRKVLGAVKQALAMNRKPWICENCGRADDKHYDHSCTGRKEDACHTSNVQWHRRRIFSLSLGDWLDPEVPIEWLAEMLDTIRRCDQVIWILCSKRLSVTLWRERLAAAEAWGCANNSELTVWLSDWYGGKAPKNIWLLASAENQEMANKRVPELLKIPAVVHGLSCEPLLGPIDLNRLTFPNDICDQCGDQITNSALTQTAHCSCCVEGDEAIAWYTLDWVIPGGESGKNARPCNIEWSRSLKEQCVAASVAFFMKQAGANLSDSDLDTCAKASGRSMQHPKGGDPAEWPEDLRVREFPSHA